MFSKKKFRKITSMLLISALSFSIGYCSSFGYAKLNNGFLTKPVYVLTNRAFLDATKNAVSYACLEINAAGAGNIIWRQGNSESSTFPNRNYQNFIGSGKRGTKYLMCTYPTDIYSLLNKVTEADIDINVDYPWANNGSSSSFDVQNCITHELGHLLGLDEQKATADTEKTMYYQAKPGETKKRTLEVDDKNGIIYFYK